MEIQRQLNFSPAPGTLDIALHQPGSETVKIFSTNLVSKECTGRFKQMGVQEPTLSLRRCDTILYKLPEKVDHEGKVMQGIEKTNKSLITYWPLL